MDKIPVVRRRLTFADHLKDVDARIARAEGALEKLQAERRELIASEKARVALLQEALESAGE